MYEEYELACQIAICVASAWTGVLRPVRLDDHESSPVSSGRKSAHRPVNASSSEPCLAGKNAVISVAHLSLEYACRPLRYLSSVRTWRVCHFDVQGRRVGLRLAGHKFFEVFQHPWCCVFVRELRRVWVNPSVLE